MQNTVSNIQINDLVFRYPSMSSACLDIPEFHTNAGDRVFLYGPSGSGKSTLLGLLGGVLSAEQGSIKILGNDFTKMPQTLRDKLRADHIGFIFSTVQSDSLSLDH